MKVCHFVSSPGLVRGNAFVTLANALCENIEVVVVAPVGACFGEELDKGIELIEYKSRNSRINPFLYLELFRLFRNIEPDLVHSHFAKASAIFHRLSRWLGIPQVATKHNPRKGAIFNRLSNVIAVSEGVAGSISHDRVKVIYNGIEPVAIPAPREGGVFSICAVGRLDRIKGFDLLVQQVAGLDFDFSLQIIGEGQERGALEALIRDLGLDEKVKLLGFRSDIPALLSQSSLQVMSSLSEGFSLAMVEAIFYANVFISTRVGGCEEILDSQFLFDHKDMGGKIADVYRNYASYLDAFQHAKKPLVNKLNIRAVASDYLKYYEGITK